MSDANLTSRIYAARKALGDDGQRQKLIRTIARKGHRFVGAVRAQPEGNEPAVPIVAELRSNELREESTAGIAAARPPCHRRTGLRQHER